MDQLKDQDRGARPWTPGPWTTGPAHVVARRSTDAEGRRTSRFVAEAIDAVPDLGEREANARLIASAPDLYEALVTLVYETTHLSPERPDGSHDCRISAEALAAARAALRKATGDA